MNRRSFLKALGATALSPAIPSFASEPVVKAPPEMVVQTSADGVNWTSVGIDFARTNDNTVIVLLDQVAGERYYRVSYEYREDSNMDFIDWINHEFGKNDIVVYG